MPPVSAGVAVSVSWRRLQDALRARHVLVSDGLAPASDIDAVLEAMWVVLDAWMPCNEALVLQTVGQPQCPDGTDGTSRYREHFMQTRTSSYGSMIDK